MNRDPIKFFDSMNFVEYVGSTPQDATDPLGLGRDIPKGHFPLTDGYYGRFDTWKIGNGERTGHMHVYDKHGKEIAKINWRGGWGDEHSGRGLCRPSEVSKDLRKKINKSLRAEVRAAIRGGIKFGGARPGRIGGRGFGIAGIAITIMLGGDPGEAIADSFDPFGSTRMGDAELHPSEERQVDEITKAIMAGIEEMLRQMEEIECEKVCPQYKEPPNSPL